MRAWAEARNAAAFTVSDTLAGNAHNRLFRYYTIRCNIASQFFGQMASTSMAVAGACQLPYLGMAKPELGVMSKQRRENRRNVWYGSFPIEGRLRQPTMS
jgi:hypothetical protein